MVTNYSEEGQGDVSLSSLFHDDVELLPPLTECKLDNHVLLRPLLYKLWIACHILKLGHEARFASLVTLHRYYAYSAGNEALAWKWIGAACIVIGCKMEETTRRLRDIINVAIMLDFSLQHSNDSTITIQSQPPDLNAAYWKAKEELVSTEQAVLRVLAFEVTISHPHRLVKILLEQNSIQESDQQSALLPIAWRRLNDALFWAPALTHSAMGLAMAAIQLSKDELDAFPLQTKVLTQFGVDEKSFQRTISDLKKATAALYESE